ncbi:hypothetical protein KC19_VG216400 [Ceratodon purpureus]|uniref:Uncharacterized protein n=1 Tax=Ceratodon purpureus TaxID=3225 RepID=A0A8T0HT08_CERPU|nr:hypothetical protein KC19_VG216400 [Ceratodon purpureus]
MRSNCKIKGTFLDTTWRGITEEDSSKGPENWSTGELVCLIFLQNFSEIAMQTKLTWGDRSNEVVAFGKLGLTCRSLRAFIEDPMVPQIMDFYIESMLADLARR